MKSGCLWFAACILFSTVAAGAESSDFSDPANTPPPPSYAIGFPSRDANLDALPGFQQPPRGYGEVAFYWWIGDPLTQERLGWQIEQLARSEGVMGLQINYAHSDRGGHSWGLTYPSDPPLFSDAWWQLVGWFMQEAKRHGMAISLSDYTLGFGQGWSVDDVLKEHPELAGSVLQQETRQVAAGDVEWGLPAGTLMVAARDSAGHWTDLRAFVRDGALKWRSPASQLLVAVFPRVVTPSLDPMNPEAGPLYARKFFGQFEDHNPQEGGKGLNFFFSDELGFGVSGNLWTSRFAQEFQRRKGYDLAPELPALFHDMGPRTPKVRLDYRDVMVALTEEGFFKPCFDWHQQRGMIFGCDHGGRGRDVVEFGDYFRTQRWNQGPGCDQPGLGCDLIKNKVASSISHLYLRPRVWLEGYYGSGWGTSTEQLVDATFANFAQGHNLLTLHGLYYSTHGGFWEWAPPCNHFRMPYWAHMREYLAMVRRISYLLSQGHHRCDVAVLYPVAPMEAGLGGKESVEAAFNTGQQLYAQGIDFDFIDFESLARATVDSRELRVSGERYRALVLPAMRAVRWRTLQKAVEFQRGGGLVAMLGALPEASDRAGGEDAQLNELVSQLTARVERPEEVVSLVSRSFPRDFEILSPKRIPVNFAHRRVGPRDIYFVHRAPAETECWFRATGNVELWDPWTGATRALPVLAQTAEGTRLRLPLTEDDAQIVVFSPGQPPVVSERRTNKNVSRITLDGPWEFELQPTLDNRFGDYRWPPTKGLIGAEARQFRCADEVAPNPGWQAADFDDSAWARATHSFGTKFWRLGPLPAAADLDSRLAQLATVDPSEPVEFEGKSYRWRPYDFSWRWGVEGDPGHQGYHGLKENVTDEFICLGARQSGRNEYVYGPEPGGTRYYLWTTVAAQRDGAAYSLASGLRPASVWLNQTQVTSRKLSMKQGANPLLLRYDKPGRGYFVVSTEDRVEGSDAEGDTDEPFTRASWIWYPETPVSGDRWFRKTFDLNESPPRCRLRITCDNAYSVSLNGQNIGQGARWETIQEFDVTRQLRAGRNVLEVSATNTGDSAGLIAELTAGSVRVVTDSTWQCAKKPAAAERDWVAAQSISGFPGSLWAQHPQGPPRLDSASFSASVERRADVPAPLAMRWWGDSSILPFDVRPRVAQPCGWYRFTAPPGLRGVSLVARGGDVQAWVDGKAVGAKRNAEHWQFDLPSPIATTACVALRIEQQRGCYGGATLPEPVTLDCGPGLAPLGDWSKTGVLDCYSGGAWYRRTVTLTPEQTHGEVWLDLGKVVSSAEVRINGSAVGIRVAPPWRFNISKQIKPGENRIEVLVFNTLANHYVTIPTHYRGELTSGLLGPAMLEIGRPD